MLTKDELEICKHQFELAKTEIIPNNLAVNINDFFKKVAYVICSKCGKVRQQDI